MRRIAAALVLVLATAPSAATELVGQLPGDTQRTIEAAATTADAHWNRRDAAALAAMYADDATLVIAGRGPALQGPDAVRGYFTTSFARTPATLRHTTTVDRIVVLAPDLVLADTRVALDDTAGATPTRVRDFNTLTVLRRYGATWKMQSVRAYPVAAATTR